MAEAMEWSGGTYRERMWAAEKAYLHEVMTAAGGNVSRAAVMADLNRTHLHHVLNRISATQYAGYRRRRGTMSPCGGRGESAS